MDDGFAFIMLVAIIFAITLVLFAQSEDRIACREAGGELKQFAYASICVKDGLIVDMEADHE